MIYESLWLPKTLNNTVCKYDQYLCGDSEYKNIKESLTNISCVVDKYFVAIDDSNNIHIYDPLNLIDTLIVEDGSRIYCMVAYKDCIITGNGNGTVKMWNLKDHSTEILLQTGWNINCMDVYEDKLIIGSSATIIILDLVTKKQLVSKEKTSVFNLNFIGNERFIVYTHDRQLKIGDTRFASLEDDNNREFVMQIFTEGKKIFLHIIIPKKDEDIHILRVYDEYFRKHSSKGYKNFEYFVTSGDIIIIPSASTTDLWNLKDNTYITIIDPNVIEVTLKLNDLKWYGEWVKNFGCGMLLHSPNKISILQ